MITGDKIEIKSESTIQINPNAVKLGIFTIGLLLGFIITFMLTYGGE